MSNPSIFMAKLISFEAATLADANRVLRQHGLSANPWAREREPLPPGAPRQGSWVLRWHIVGGQTDFWATLALRRWRGTDCWKVKFEILGHGRDRAFVMNGGAFGFRAVAFAKRAHLIP